MLLQCKLYFRTSRFIIKLKIFSGEEKTGIVLNMKGVNSSDV